MVAEDHRSQVILGIDPGFANLGLAIIAHDARSLRMIHAEVFRSHSAPQGTISKGYDDLRRTISLWNRVKCLVSEYHVDSAVLEAPSLPRHARTQYVLGLAYGALYAALVGRRLGVHLVSPRELKRRVTGCPRAPKDAVEDRVRAEILGSGPILDSLPASVRDHAADAAGAVLAYWREPREPREP